MPHSEMLASKVPAPSGPGRPWALRTGRMQPQLGRCGLFTMMAVAKVLGEGPRGWIACNILRNIQWHYRNVTLFYHAELRIKYQLLMEAGQVRPARKR